MICAVVYNSETGFTRRYAKWISDKLGCACLPSKGATAEQLKRYALVIYGGWVQGGVITGWNDIRPRLRGKAIVFAVGAMPASAETTAYLSGRNELGSVPLYYYEGGMNFFALKPGRKKALEMYRGILGNLPEERQTPSQAFFLKQYGQSFDHADPERAAGLVEDVRKLMRWKPNSETATK